MVICPSAVSEPEGGRRREHGAGGRRMDGQSSSLT
eukprot:SAG11_NODE_189_length_13028_cov_14.222446_15_plen_34_part_01